MTTMRAARLTGVGVLSLEEVQRPEPGPGEILLDVESTTLCGTDVRILSGQKTSGVTTGVIMGHEIAARVAAVGEGAHSPAVGTQVGLAPEYSCGTCDSCRAGRSNVCRNMRLFGTTIDGGLAQSILVPAGAVAAGNIVAADREIDPRLLSLAEPLSCCLRAHRNLGITAGTTVLVLGTGPIGLIHIALAKAAGASKIIACGRPARLAPARALGATDTTCAEGADLVAEIMEATSGRGADVVILAVGSVELAGLAPRMTAVGGIVSFFAGFGAGELLTVDPNDLHYRELTFAGSANATVDDYAAAVKMLSQDEIRLDGLVTHSFSLDRVHDAFEAQRTRAGLKVAVMPGGALFGQQ